ncbi:MAG: glycosyltransferase family 4 protein [Anaerolineales bacterium]|nr:glycosyltransferase family 4 protein [Anaerolineales bacterium]
MRILIITNYYSPCRFGWGYRQLCEEVVDRLAARGHELAVLTGTDRHGPEIERPFPVHRSLQIEPDWENGAFAPWQFFVGRRARETQAVAHLHQLVTSFQPDLIFVWHAVGISRVMLQEAARLMNGRIAYYLADYQPELADEYMAYWTGVPGNPIARLAKKPVADFALKLLAKEGKPIKLNYQHVACVSGYVRDRLVSQKLISDEAVVIHNGVDLAEFARNGRTRFTAAGSQIRCLVAGRLVALKGIHTVVNGLGLLNAKRPDHPLRLTILGDGPIDYVNMLHQKVEEYGIEAIVEFRQPVPREQMPDILNAHDIVILSSEYDEPLARAMQEGMAMGALMIGTTTGGSGELLVHNETGLVFEAGNPQSLADQFECVLDYPDQGVQLAEAGYQAILEHFNIDRMVLEVESYLRNILSQQRVMS